MMKKLLGLGFILAALAVVTMGMVGFPKLDVNIWPLFPVLLFAFFTLENLMKQVVDGFNFSVMEQAEQSLLGR